jgi:PEP-CTERM motif
MIKKLALAAVLSLSASSIFAASGIFGSGVELNANGTATLYALDNGGTTRLTPVGSTATLDQTSWANGSEAAPVLNLGTFDPGLGQTLTLTGGSLLTFKSTPSDVTAAWIDYRVFTPVGTPSGAFTEVGLPFNEDNVNGTTGDQRWATEALSVNLLSGLTPGTYELGVFLREDSTDGGAFSTQNGANYGATFTVVPEPATILLVGPALLGGWFFARRRRAS